MSERIDGGAGTNAFRPPRRRPAAARAVRRAVWTFLLPTLLALALVGGYPLFNTFRLGFTNTSFYTETSRFVGLESFRALLADPYWGRALLNTAIFSIASVSLEVVLGLLLAVMLQARFPGRRFARVATLIPFVVPITAVAQTWKWMYHDVFGVVNDLLLGAGLIGRPIAWVDTPSTAMLSIVLVAVWKFTPFVALLALAGLQSIRAELYEAASIDGAGRLARFWHVTLPLLRDTLAVAAVFRMLDAVRVFDLIYVLTGNAVGTMSAAMYARQQLIDFGRFGYGSAASVFVFVLVLTGTSLYVRMVQDRRT
jgi:trehalose/maltose transport system permease protein